LAEAVNPRKTVPELGGKLDLECLRGQDRNESTGDVKSERSEQAELPPPTRLEFSDVDRPLRRDSKTLKKLEFNFRKNKHQDQSPELDADAARFCYTDCKHQFWNPEKFSLLYGTPVWEQSSHAQRVKLNQLYWVAYYSQIISAEIATIFFNQTSAAALYGIEDFRLVCDTLDLESAQERAHIAAFKKISEDFEVEVFGERIFTYPMRTPFAETMIFNSSHLMQKFWRNMQLRAFTLLSSERAFIGCQYFTVRGIRTLNGKLVQHQLAQFHIKNPDKDSSPIPSRVSYYHFMDESFHFNSSNIIGHDVLRLLRPPNRFERWVANQSLRGMQRDHTAFSSAINGIFWYDPALYDAIYKVLRSPIFAMSRDEALQMMEKSFCHDSVGTQESFRTRNLALDSYQEYVSDLAHIDRSNREMLLMKRNSVEKHLANNQAEMRQFYKRIKNNGDLLSRRQSSRTAIAGAGQPV
jgi:hypothetical protein